MTFVSKYGRISLLGGSIWQKQLKKMSRYLFPRWNKQLVELSFKRDELKKQYEELNTQLEEVLTTLGVDSFFQDKDGTVYKVVVPKGSFISFKHIDYVRTRRGDEKIGSLSLKEAEALMGSIKK